MYPTSQTFLPLDVALAVQDLLKQGHQGEGADEDEEQSSIPQQIPVGGGVCVAHPGGPAPWTHCAGRGGNHARCAGPRGPLGELSRRGQEGRGLGGAKFPAGAVAAAAAKGQGRPRGDRLSPRPALSCCGFWAPVSRSRLYACGGATAGARPDRPPAEVMANGDPGRRGWAETQPDAPPTLGWLGIRGARCVGLAGDSASGPRARGSGVRRLAFDAAEARWATQPQDSGLWGGGGSSVKGRVGIVGFRGAQTAEATLLRRAFACGAQVTESPRQPRPRALLENPP